MKTRLSLFVMMILAGLLAQAVPVIEVGTDTVQFGQVAVGYPVTKTITVTGSDLEGNINLAISGRYADEYKVTPEIITAEDAAAGVRVTVKYSPRSKWSGWADLLLTSANAADLVIPIAADPQMKSTIYGYNNQRYFVANVGETDSSVETAYFADVEVPTDPTQPPVVRAPIGGIEADITDFVTSIGNYQVSIDGDDCFCAMIVKSSSIVNTCNVRISYTPLTSGSHHATLKVMCSNAGVPLIVVYLNGSSADQPFGDTNGDGIIAINDVTNMIDALLLGDGLRGSGDMNGDHMLTITDVTRLIDLLLSGE